MNPIEETDGDDAPEGLEETVPRVTAVGEDVVVIAEAAIGQPVSRMNCQTFSSGHFAGRGSKVMLSGTMTSLERCHPA